MNMCLCVRAHTPCVYMYSNYFNSTVDSFSASSSVLKQIKSIALQAWTGPYGSVSARLTEFLNS